MFCNSCDRFNVNVKCCWSPTHLNTWKERIKGFLISKFSASLQQLPFYHVLIVQNEWLSIHFYLCQQQCLSYGLRLRYLWADIRSYRNVPNTFQTSVSLLVFNLATCSITNVTDCWRTCPNCACSSLIVSSALLSLDFRR